MKTKYIIFISVNPSRYATSNNTRYWGDLCNAMNNAVSKPSILHAEPVLAVADVSATVNYYHEVLGFPDKWTWGEPPNHGGVSWNGGAFLQFSLNAALAQGVKGESVWLNVREIEKLYDSHRKNKADIVIELVHRPWGFTEYTVRDLNGHFVTFAERTTVQQNKGNSHRQLFSSLNRQRLINCENLLNRWDGSHQQTQR